jgi:hypothetical protein
MTTSNANKSGTVYVMTCSCNTCPCNWIRVGHHTTSNVLREAQVSQGWGYVHKIKHSIRFKTKLEAAAVEAIAHLILKKYECSQQGTKVNKNGKFKGGQVFRCSEQIALCAIQQAADQLVKSGLATIIP